MDIPEVYANTNSESGLTEKNSESSGILAKYDGIVGNAPKDVTVSSAGVG